MVPVRSPDAPLRNYPRQSWVPSTVSFPARGVSGRQAETSYTSADELCAASVLMSLTPKKSSPALSHPTFRQVLPQQSVESLSIFQVSHKSKWCQHQMVPSSGSESTSLSRVTDTGDYSSGNESSCDSPGSIGGVSSKGWCRGSVSLSLLEDNDVLSPLHCFMRRYCVEAFSATPEDVATPRYGKSHGVKVLVGQVGIRCLYCRHRPIGKRPERAVCYPSSLRNIYHSIETWQRRHSLVCSDITPWVKKSIMELMESSKSRAGGRRQYWEDSAMRLGMVDTPYGVRFARTPGDIFVEPDIVSSMLPGMESTPVVREEDRELITEYLFLLMDQMQTCKFAEEDRTGGRSKIKNNRVGFPGMQCRHCHGKAGFGRYFPSTVHALALANSDRNIYNHIQKCRRCPNHIKARLLQLSREQAQCKNKRGLRKMFFKRVWKRMHGTSS